MNDLQPLNYKIHLEPDLQRFQFSGTTEIVIDAPEKVDEIPLNALDLAVWGCQVKVDGTFRDSPFSVDAKKEELRVYLPDPMTGKIELKIDYVGEINNKMAGFYRSKYVARGKEKYMAVTQFEESDARRAFPCFDHPVKKATFDVEIVAGRGLVAISNGPVIKETPVEDGRTLITFQQTPKMSTYLLFFAVGEFTFIEDPGEVLVRVATIPGMKKYGRFGLKFGRKSLEFSEAYYDIKYPLPKLDLIAIADFAAGAMENWGAITFRENLLLHFPAVTSKAGRERICEVIAHEMAHQWFGNLVTPSDWKYLWLNESFATYFGSGVVDHYYPEWDVWDQFLHGQTGSSLERDSLWETFPIEIPGGEHVVINASTAPIIYSKGGSILRQVEGYVGHDNFKEGLRVYLKKHEYACASSHHLWDALEGVSEKPISKMMKSWIEQPGFPIVEVNREEDRLILTQKRFTYLPRDSEQEWQIPVAIKIFDNHGGSKVVKTLLDLKRTVIDIGPDVAGYKVNEGQTGFYRVKYKEKGNLEELGRRVADNGFSREDRWGLQNDLYALVKKGDIPLDEYLDFISSYSNEKAFLPLISIASNLFHAFLVMEGSKRERVASVGRGLVERVFEDIGYEPRPDEKHSLSILREPLIWDAVMYGSENVKAFALDQFSSLVAGKKIHPDIVKSVMQIGAWNGDDETFEWFDRSLGSSGSEHERMNILTALGCFGKRDLIEKTLNYVLTNVPDRNKFIPIGILGANPQAIPLMWEWYRDHVEPLEQFHPVHYERVIAAIVPLSGIGKEEEVRGFFDDYMQQKEKARGVIKLSLEKLEINSRMRSS